MNFNNLKPRIETTNKELERYNEFKKRYYIYRVDDIIENLQKDNTELSKLYKQEEKMYNDLKLTLSPTQQHLLLEYSDNWQDIINEEINELTKQILADFEQEK
ncbi:MAG: hypothetical protein J6A36_02350 [Clostridia bacterium]|nr:hypothetical protein [Clostridia bacterium]